MNKAFLDAVQIRTAIILSLLFFSIGGVVSSARASSFDSASYYRKLVRMKDLDLKDIIHTFQDSSDYAYREVEIRQLDNDLGGELKDALWKTLKRFIVDRGIGTQVNVDSTSFVNSVQIYAGVAADSVDIFRIQFSSQRSTTTNEIDRKYLQLTGETRFVPKTTNYTIYYDIIGVNAYDALQQTFVAGEYKDMTVADVLQKEFLSPLNSSLIDLYGGFGNFGDKIVLDSHKRLQYYHLFNGFYSVEPTYDTINQRDTTILYNEYDTHSNPPKIIPKSKDSSLFDLQLSSRVQPVFQEPLMDFSLLRQLTLNPFHDKDFGFQVRLGNEEVGLPLWTSGTGQGLLILRNKIFEQSVFKIGLVFPFGVGESSSGSLFSPRQMAGSWGFCAEGLIPAFDIPEGLNLPVGFSLQYIPSFSKNSTVIDTTQGANIYYASFIGTLYFPFIIDLNPRLRTSFVQLQVGAGWEDITRAVAAYPGMVINGDSVKSGSSTVGELQSQGIVSTRILPHVRVDYVNHESAKFSLFTQYDHRLMLGGWVELFSGFRIELEYSTTLGPPDPWEPQTFFLISPRIRIL